MTNQEMVKILSGGHDGKLRLFNDMTAKVIGGSPLSDNEIPIFEALKKDLIRPKSEVVSIEAQLFGKSHAKVK